MTPEQWSAHGYLMYPHTLAMVASQGHWQPYRHLRYLSSVIGPAIARGNARIIVESPPRVGKSVLCTEWNALWFFQNFPRRNVMVAAYAADLAHDFGRRIRNQLQFNPALPVRLSADSTAADRFRTTAGGEFFALGVGGSASGRGAHLLLIDDPIKDWKEATSEVRRTDIINWWNSVAETRIEPGGSVVVTATRWHDNDLSGYLQAQGGWTTIHLPAICENPELDPIGRKLGEALCPERYDEDFYARKKKNSPPMIWEALYQQRPVPPSGTIVERGWLKFYRKIPDRFDRIIQSWDLTFNDSAKSDFVCGQVWGVHEGKFYLLFQIRDRLSFTGTIAAMAKLSKIFPDSYTKLVEKKANGDAVINVLDGKLGGIKAIVPKESKESRLHAVAPLYQMGLVVYPDPEIYPWVQTNIDELLKFGAAAHDDTVDTTTQALTELADNSGDYLAHLTSW